MSIRALFPWEQLRLARKPFLARLAWQADKRYRNKYQLGSQAKPLYVRKAWQEVRMEAGELQIFEVEVLTTRRKKAIPRSRLKLLPFKV